MTSKGAAKQSLPNAKPGVSELSRRFGKQVWAYREKHNISLTEIAQFGIMDAPDLHQVEVGALEIDACKMHNIITAFPGIKQIQVELD